MIYVQDVRKMKDDGSQRVLVDREWPRGVIRAIPHKEQSGTSKRALAAILWRPKLAPSAELWKWFQVNPDKADHFRARYFNELLTKRSVWLPIAQASKKEDTALLYQAKNLPFAPAHFFKEFLGIQAGHVAKKHAELPGTSGRGLSLPVGQVVSRKYARPLRVSARLAAEQKLRTVPPKNRRTVK